MRNVFSVLCVTFLSGCAMFSEEASVSQSRPGPTSNNLNSLVPGSWYRITNYEQSRLGLRSQTELIGKLARADEDSITLAKVQGKSRKKPPLVLKDVPFIRRHYDNNVTFEMETRELITVPRDQILSITPAPEVETLGQFLALSDFGPPENEWESLTPGRWYRVMEMQMYLVEDEEGKRGINVQIERVGQLVRSDAMSAKLTGASSRNCYEPPLLLRWVPRRKPSGNESDYATEGEVSSLIVSREAVRSIIPITEAEAAELKRTFNK